MFDSEVRHVVRRKYRIEPVVIGVFEIALGVIVIHIVLDAAKKEDYNPFYLAWWGAISILPGIIGIAYSISLNYKLMIAFTLFNWLTFLIQGITCIAAKIIMDCWSSTVKNKTQREKYCSNENGSSCTCVRNGMSGWCKEFTAYSVKCDELESFNGVLKHTLYFTGLFAVAPFLGAIVGTIATCRIRKQRREVVPPPPIQSFRIFNINHASSTHNTSPATSSKRTSISDCENVPQHITQV